MRIVNLGYCPTCKAEFEIPKGTEDKTYTIDCLLCGDRFSYCVVDGKHQEWHATKIAGIRVYEKKRQGETAAYGKKDSKDIPVIS